MEKKGKNIKKRDKKHKKNKTIKRYLSVKGTYQKLQKKQNLNEFKSKIYFKGQLDANL